MAERGSQDEKYCSNCKKYIASTNFIMHEVHCKRHIVLCKKCKEPVPRSEEEDHFNTYHVEVACDLCKMKVEIDQLDNHKVSDCPNKPGNCSYCELEMPGCDLSHHEGYCGTRTEPCVSCEQFIMIKDFNRHLESGCTYPTPKPQPVSAGATNMPEFFGHNMDPFTFDEIHRILDEATVPSLSSLTTGEQGNRFHVPPRHTVRNNTSDRSHKNTTNRRSDVNKQHELSGTSPTTQYDNMLSQMLAASQDTTTDLTQYMEAFQKQVDVPVLTGSESFGSNSSINRYNDDDLLPCEFCGEPFPSDIIIQHQSGCDLLASGTWSNSQPVSLEGQNNEIQPKVHRSTAFIPVINNLDNNRQQWQSSDVEVDTPINNVNNDFDEMDDVMLPCEFCTELFPTEMLVIHQSICDANTTVTPRVMTPVSPYQPKLKKHNRPIDYTSNMSDNHFNTSRSTRRQGAPPKLADPDYETMQNNNKTNDPVLMYNRSDLTANGHSAKYGKSSSLNKMSNGERVVRRTSRKKASSRPEETLDNLLHDDLDVRAPKNTERLDAGGASGGAGPGVERKKNAVPISAKKVFQELEKTDNIRPNKRSNKSSYNDENKDTTPSSTRQRSSHLLNADSRSRTSQQPKSTTKSKNLPRR